MNEQVSMRENGEDSVKQQKCGYYTSQNLIRYLKFNK